MRGVSRSSRTWDAGCGGRGSIGRNSLRETTDAFAFGEVVWSWRPDADAKFASDLPIGIPNAAAGPGNWMKALETGAFGLPVPSRAAFSTGGPDGGDGGIDTAGTSGSPPVDFCGAHSRRARCSRDPRVARGALAPDTINIR
jgi:hypothetical protein